MKLKEYTERITASEEEHESESQQRLRSCLGMLYTSWAESVRSVCVSRKKQLKSEINVNICKHISAGNVGDLDLGDVRKLPELVDRHFPTSLAKAVRAEVRVRFLNEYLDMALGSPNFTGFERHLYLFREVDPQNPFADFEKEGRVAALRVLGEFVNEHRADLSAMFSCEDAAMTQNGQKPNTLAASLKNCVARLEELDRKVGDPTGGLPGAKAAKAAEAEARFTKTLIHSIVAFKVFADEAEDTIFDMFGPERLEYFSSWENFFVEYLQKAVKAAYERIIDERLYVPDSYEEGGMRYFRIAFHMELVKHVVEPLSNDDILLFRTTVQQNAHTYDDEQEAVKAQLIQHGKVKLDPFRNPESEFKNLLRVIKMYPEAEEYARLRELPEVQQKKGAAKLLAKVLKRGGDDGEAERLEELERALRAIAHAVDDVLYCYSDRLFMEAVRKVFSFTIEQDGEMVRISRVAKRVERYREKAMFGPEFCKWTLYRIVHMVFYDIIRDIKGSKHEFIEGLKDSASIFDKEILVLINASAMIREARTRMEDPCTQFSPPERAELARGERQKYVLIAMGVYRAILNYTIPDWTARLKKDGVNGFMHMLATSKEGGRSRLFSEMLKLRAAELMRMEPGGKDSGQLNFYLLNEALKAELRMLEASPDKSGRLEESEPESEECRPEDDLI